MGVYHVSKFCKLLLTYLIVVSNKFFSLFNASIQFWNSSLQQILLICGQCSQTKVLLHTIWSQDNRGGKIFGLCHIGLNIGTLNDTLLTVHALDEAVCEPGSGISHGQGGTSGSILGLDNFSSSILNTFGESLQLFCGEFNSWGALADEGHDGDSSVAPNNGAVDLGRVDVLEFTNESVGPDHIQGGHSEDSLGVQAARLCRSHRQWGLWSSLDLR